MTLSTALRRDLSRSLDPLSFAEEVGIELDDWQRDVLADDSQSILLNCSRQSGKSTVTALKALHSALTKPGDVLMIAAAHRQSRELFRKFKQFYLALEGKPRALNDNQMSIELVNGVRVHALPGSEATIRGFSDPALVIIDEAARTDDVLLPAVRPMLAVSGGQLIALSTPYGRQGWYYKAWHQGEGYKRYKVTAYDCPRISAEYLEQERAMIGPWQFAQEFECQFMDDSEQFFSSALIEAALSDEAPLWS